MIMIDQKCTNVHQSRYNSKYARKSDMIIVWETTNKEECFKQLVLESRFKIAGLIRESKHRT